MWGKTFRNPGAWIKPLYTTPGCFLPSIKSQQGLTLSYSLEESYSLFVRLYMTKVVKPSRLSLLQENFGFIT